MFKIEYRAVIKFFTKEGLSPAQIKHRLDGVYGASSPSYSTVKEWAKLFKLGRETLEDDPRSGRPAEAVTPEMIDLVDVELLKDRRLKTKEIAARLTLSKTTVIRIIKEHLHMNKVSARWVPRLLSGVQKDVRVKCCREFLEEYSLDPEMYLK